MGGSMEASLVFPSSVGASSTDFNGCEITTFPQEPHDDADEHGFEDAAEGFEVLDAEGVGAIGPAQCSALSQEEHMLEYEIDTGDAVEDLLFRTCVHCSSSGYLSRCANCHQFSCARCSHRCGPQCGDERSGRDRSRSRGDRRSGDAAAPSSASSACGAPTAPPLAVNPGTPVP